MREREREREREEEKGGGGEVNSTLKYKSTYVHFFFSIIHSMRTDRPQCRPGSYDTELQSTLFLTYVAAVLNKSTTDMVSFNI